MLAGEILLLVRCWLRRTTCSLLTACKSGIWKFRPQTVHACRIKSTHLYLLYFRMKRAFATVKCVNQQNVYCRQGYVLLCADSQWPFCFYWSLGLDIIQELKRVAPATADVLTACDFQLVFQPLSYTKTYPRTSRGATVSYLKLFSCPFFGSIYATCILDYGHLSQAL